MKRLAIVVAIAMLAAPATAFACPKTSLADIEDEVMCPVCGVPLELATEAPQANRERAFIQREVQACKSKKQIKDELVAQFGPRVLALPPSHGFNLFAYLAPAAAVLLGIGIVATVLSRRRRGQTPGGPPTPVLSSDEAARLDADLKRYEL
jgi:cytochrome c-type biogenesis protein CcmH